MKIAPCFALLALVGAMGCSQMPTAGPERSQVIDQANSADGKAQFALVEVDDHVITALASEPSLDDQVQLLDRGKPPPITIGVGDSVAVLLWQSASGNIFGDAALGSTPVPAPTSNATTTGPQSVAIPEQVVGNDGTITIPFIGRMKVANRTTASVQIEIQRRLQDRAFNPQAMVTVTKSISTTITIAGEGVNAARVPLSPRGDRLLDIIATAGGSKSEPYETSVRITRTGETTTVSLSRLISNPSDNIYAWPGDVITLVKEPRMFSVFGATQTNTDIAFGADQVNLAQAIAKAGGLQDTRADPMGVFLFRFEPASVATALGVPPTPNGDTRVVYHLNLHDVSSYFLARRFAMQDNDIIFSANAPMSDLQKFFTLVGSITAPTLGGVVGAQSVAGRP